MNRTQYLKLRATWKASYAQLTLDIRAAKAKKVESARAWSKNGGSIRYTRNMSAEELAKYGQANILAGEFYEQLRYRDELRAEANKMLSELSVLKIAAQTAYREAKEQTA